MSKKLVFITTRLFWPADSGRKVSLYHYCKGLHEQLGYDVYVYAFLEGGQSAEKAFPHPGFLKDVRVASPVSFATKVKNLIAAVFSPSMPFQCALYRSSENHAAIRSFCEDVEPDVVMIDMIRFAPYIDAIDGLGCPVVLDYDDLLSKRYARQVGEGGGNLLGNYAAQASGLVGRLFSNDAVKNAVLSLESNRVRKAEDLYARRADAVLFVSPIEANELDARLGTNKCFSATVGAEIEEPPSRLPVKEYDLGFVGNFNTAANQASLGYICNEILPLIPDSSFRVIGVCPDEVKKRYDAYEQVSFSGRVETISEELLKCKVMLAPFAYGSGIKTKVLEAMGMGIPVVTNFLGIEGMTCKLDVEVKVGETAQELANACRTLLNSPEGARALGLAGKEYVRRCHDWRTSVENLDKCLCFAVTAKAMRQSGALD